MIHSNHVIVLGLMIKDVKDIIHDKNGLNNKLYKGYDSIGFDDEGFTGFDNIGFYDEL